MLKLRPGECSTTRETSGSHTAADLRVALFVNTVEIGGIDEHVRHLADGLGAQGAKVTVIYPESPTVDTAALAAEQTGAEVWRITLSKQLGLSHCAKRFFHLIRLLRARGVHVFHVHLIGYRGGRWALLAARLARVPAVICTIQIAPERREPWPARMEQKLINLLVDQFIAVSQVTRERLITYLDIAATKIVMIPNAVDLARYRHSRGIARSEIRKHFGVPEDAPLIGVTARLSEQKGLTYLIAAIPYIIARVPNVHVLLVGQGPLRMELEEQARALRVQDHVHFAGHQGDVPSYLRAMDVFALPSLFEGLPLSVLEAMAAGLPVIATNVDGTPEAVEHGVSGFLVPAREPIALARAVLELLENPRTAASLAAGARARAQQYSTPALVDRVRAVYSRLLIPARRSKPSDH